MEKAKDFSRKTVWPGSTQLAPVPVVLVGSGDGEKYPWNLVTIAWAGTVNSNPPMVSISVRPERHSFPAIRELGVFTVNIPPASLAKTVDWCGVVSGRDHDKIAEQHLTAVAGDKVCAPVLAECPLVRECKVAQSIDLGSHTLFLAEVVAVQAAEELIDKSGKFRIDDAGLLGYAHGHYYELGKCLGHFGYSVRKKPGPTVRR